jgi:hypothetical protein
MDWEKQRVLRAAPTPVIRRCWTRWGADHWAYRRWERPHALSSTLRGEPSEKWFEEPHAIAVHHTKIRPAVQEETE